jgi:hypothetical protein
MLAKENVHRTEETLTVLDKYQTFEISGTSGKTKNPAMAIGSDMTPSVMKSLGGVSIFSSCSRHALTIAIP